jgi:hypothetical protein
MKKLLTSLLLACFSIVFFASCEKDELDYNLTIKITVDGDTPVQNAVVRVYAPVTGAIVDYFVFTDDNGESVIEFKNKAVVEIIAQKGSFRACSFAEVIQGGSTVRIDLQPFGAQENGCITQ